MDDPYSISRTLASANNSQTLASANNSQTPMCGNFRVTSRREVSGRRSVCWAVICSSLLWSGALGQVAIASPQDLPTPTPTITEPMEATADGAPSDSQTESEATASPAADDERSRSRPSLPEPAKIQKQIDELEKDDSIPEEEKGGLRAALQATLGSLEAVVEAQRQAEQRDLALEAIKEIPAKTLEVKKSLEEQSSSPPAVSIPADLPIEELRGRKTQAEADWAAARRREADLLAKESERASLKASLTKTVAEEKAKLEKLQAEKPPEGPDVNPILTAAEATRIAAEIFLTEQKIESLWQQRRIAEAEEELLPAQIKLAKQAFARQQTIVQRYAEAINARQTVQLENALESYRKALSEADIDPTRSIIDRYDDDWMQIVRDQTRITRESAHVLQQRRLYEERMAASKAEIERADERGRGVGSGLGLKLQRNLSKLPTPHDLNAAIAKVDAQIEWARTFQADVEHFLDVLEGDGIGLDSAVVSGQLGPRDAGEGKPAWSLDEFRQQEIEMLQKLNSDVEGYLNDLFALRERHESLRDTVDEYRELINLHVMWIRSDRRYNRSDLSLAWSSFQQWMVHPQNLSRFGESLWAELFRRPDGVILWLLSLLGWAVGGSRLRRRIMAYRDQAIRGNQVSMQPTVRTLLATIALAALPTLFVAIPGWRIYRIPLASNYLEAIGLGLLASSALLFPMELIRQVIRPGGLGVAHFGWKESTIQPLRAAIRCTTDLMLIFVFFWTLAAKSDIVAIASSLGRPLFAALMATVSYGLWRALHPRTGMPAERIRRQAGGWLDRLRYVWHPAIAAFPLGLGILSLLGYRYSSEQLTMLLYKTLWLGIGLLLLQGLLRRWVLLSRRRLLLQQIRERAEAAEKQAEGESEEVIPIDPESESLDITDVNAQTLRLIHAFLATLAIIGLLWTWSAVLPALNYLKSQAALWDSDGNTILTMANVFLPIPIIVLTIIAWRNVPGLLETALLQRLPLDNATRYAVTTLSSYGLFMIGMVLSAAQFGLKWDNIQWLVAALGVGLGFGLQEIFANFISGIILLFEQPLRVGDVVTLGDTTGVVSRIRIRATTITNWERQELIVPNKDLITGRLINWTLSDSTNRIVLNIGVAYGSDTRKACAILEDICVKHENVAEDPPPIVTFEGFGDSTLNIVVRCFLTSMACRLATIHELHTETNDRFGTEGIEIAFPQRDLNIRTLPDALTGTLAQQRTHESIL